MSDTRVDPFDAALDECRTEADVEQLVDEMGGHFVDPEPILEVWRARNQQNSNARCPECGTVVTTVSEDDCMCHGG